MKISASIYSDKNRALKATIEDLVAHQVDMLHVDCNDDPKVFDDILLIRQWCDLPIDLHIISENPEQYFEQLKSLNLEYVTFQYEQLPKKITFTRDLGQKLGLAIITPTSVEVFDEYDDFDFLLLMATVPGQSGGVFDKVNFHKIRSFKTKYPTKKVHVDGGVNGEVSFILRNMGVRASVSGSFLFKAASVGQALMDLTKREIQSQFKVKDFMIPIQECPLLSLEDLSLEKILKSVDDGNLGFVMVEHNGLFRGIISNAEIRRGLIKNIHQLNDFDLRTLVNENPVVISTEDSVNSMLSIVKECAFQLHYLPVVDAQNKPSGAVTFVNLIKGEV